MPAIHVQVRRDRRCLMLLTRDGGTSYRLTGRYLYTQIRPCSTSYLRRRSQNRQDRTPRLSLSLRLLQLRLGRPDLPSLLSSISPLHTLSPNHTLPPNHTLTCTFPRAQRLPPRRVPTQNLHIIRRHARLLWR